MTLLINDTFECRGISPSIHTAVPQATFNQASAILVHVTPKQPQHFMRAKYFLRLLANRLGLAVSDLFFFSFPDEDFSIPHGKRGIVGMANRGRHTNGSQFFITLQPAPWMDTKYVAFG